MQQVSRVRRVGARARQVGHGAVTWSTRRLAAALGRVRGRVAGQPGDAGLATAEYAVVMVAAVGFAGLLVVILRSAEVRAALTDLVRDALSV